VRSPLRASAPRRQDCHDAAGVERQRDHGLPRGVPVRGPAAEYVDLLVRLIEGAGALIIFVGCVVAAVRFVQAAVVRGPSGASSASGSGLGRYLALGLEFQLASDILSTAIAPTFEEIGKLAAIAAIRTALNYFLNKEIDEERAEVERERAEQR
jgi:uncharacterized membrane protein